MNPLFIQYPKCTTCKKAKAWLESKQIYFDERHIVESNPSHHELYTWCQASGLPQKRFFNTSGAKYRELKLATQLANMDDVAQLALLATDGMLVKRPILVTDRGVCPGFKEDVWMELLGLNA